MIKNLATFFKESPNNWTYYPERYYYHAIRSLMRYLFDCTSYKDKLTLEDLVWIDPTYNKQYRNRFANMNSDFLENFVYSQTTGKVFSNLIKRCADNDPEWLKKQLKANPKFWKSITS